MGETGVMLGATGEPLAPGVAWHDIRGQPESKRMAEDLGAATFASRTGLPVGPSWTAPKLEALLATHPEIRNGRRWLSVAEWVVAWLGGEHMAELSLASRTGFLDVTERAWWGEALDRVGLSSEVMPPLALAGASAGVVTRIAELTGATLTVAGHDHPCASVGAYAFGLGDAFDSCGTAEAIVRSIPASVDAEKFNDAASVGISIGCHVVPSRQVVMGFFEAGITLTRVLKLLGADNSGPSREALDAGALVVDIAPAADVEVADDSLVVSGMEEHADPAAIWAAAQVSAARKARGILDQMERVAVPHDRLVVAGGWTRNYSYRALKRPVMGPFETPVISEAGARGAALFAGLAAGIYDSIDAFPLPLMIHVD